MSYGHGRIGGFHFCEIVEFLGMGLRLPALAVEAWEATLASPSSTAILEYKSTSQPIALTQSARIGCR